jgi:hypothetical protein
MSVNYKAMRKLGFCRLHIIEFCSVFGLDFKGVHTVSEIKEAIENTPDSKESLWFRAGMAFRIEGIIENEPELLALFRGEVKALGEASRTQIPGLAEL